MNSKRVGYFLLGLVLLIEIPRFYGTYAGIDPLLLGLPLTAIGTGVALPVGAGYVFHAWWKTTKSRRNWLLVAFGVLLALEGIILIPWGMARLQSQPLAQIVGAELGAWFWIGVVMLSPFVVVGAVVMGMAFQKDTANKPKQKPNKSEQKPNKPEHHVLIDEQTDHVRCDTCGRVFAWPGDYPDERTAKRALAGHQNAHRTEGNG